MVTMRKGAVRLEYKGLNRNALYRQAALDHSDNGRCWWIAMKIQERLALDESQKRRICRTRKQKTERVDAGKAILI